MSARVGIKICGLTRVADALVALDAGADALGFILAEGSPRRLLPHEARDLVTRVRAETERPFESVAVLGRYDAEAARHALTELGFDRVQLVGFERTPAQPLLMALRELGSLAARVWGSVRVKDASSFDGLEEAPCEAFVLDAWRVDALGGTGHAFDWELAIAFAARRKVLLAGGLNAGNVAEAIAVVHPWRVDVASGVEDSPGIKSAAKIRAFTEAVRHGE